MTETVIRTRRDGLSVDDAAAELGVHKNTVYNWIKEGRLPYTQIGRLVKRIKPEDLDRFRGAPPHPPGGTT